MNIQRLLTGGALMVMACGLASASTIAGTCSTAAGPTELGPAPGPSNGTVSCSQFNVGGATLNSISLTITGSVINFINGNTTNPLFNSTITLNNTSQTQTNNFSGTTFSGMNLVAPLAGFSFTNDFFGNLLTVAAPTGVVILGPGASQVVNVSGTNSASATNTTSFGAYTGAGNFSFDIASLTTLNCSTGGGQGGCEQSTFDSVTASVIYNYTDEGGPVVPEPATMALFGSAMIGLGVMRKRLSAK